MNWGYIKDSSVSSSGIFYLKDRELQELHPNYFDATEEEVLAALSINQRITQTIYFIEAIDNVESIIFNRITREPLVIYTTTENTKITLQQIINCISKIDWEYEEEKKRKMDLFKLTEKQKPQESERG